MDNISASLHLSLVRRIWCVYGAQKSIGRLAQWCLGFYITLGINLSDGIMDNIAASLHLSLVKRFLAFRPIIDLIRRWMNSRWNLKWSKEDLIHVISSSWSSLTLSKQKLCFDPSGQLNCFALVQMRLPGLQLEFWHKRVFRQIGNSFRHYAFAKFVMYAGL